MRSRGQSNQLGGSPPPFEDTDAPRTLPACAVPEEMVKLGDTEAFRCVVTIGVAPEPNKPLGAVGTEGAWLAWGFEVSAAAVEVATGRM